jgi:hypothetical protein
MHLLLLILMLPVFTRLMLATAWGGQNGSQTHHHRAKGWRDRGRMRRPETCGCHGLPDAREPILILECPVCAGHLVRCPRCEKVAWWPDTKRAVALNAAEAHRWETGHPRVVARGFGGGHVGQIVMEVGDE